MGSKITVIAVGRFARGIAHRFATCAKRRRAIVIEVSLDGFATKHHPFGLTTSSSSYCICDSGAIRRLDPQLRRRFKFYAIAYGVGFICFFYGTNSGTNSLTYFSMNMPAFKHIYYACKNGHIGNGKKP